MLELTQVRKYMVCQEIIYSECFVFSMISFLIFHENTYSVITFVYHIINTTRVSPSEKKQIRISDQIFIFDNLYVCIGKMYYCTYQHHYLIDKNKMEMLKSIVNFILWIYLLREVTFIYEFLLSLLQQRKIIQFFHLHLHQLFSLITKISFVFSLNIKSYG